MSAYENTEGAESTNVMGTEESRFNVKRIVRILSLICIVFFFCPAFLVSCSGQEVEVDAMTAVGGMSMYGETVVEPHPIMLICLLAPIGVFILTFVKKFTQKKIAGYSFVCMLADIIAWIVFATSTKRIAEENYATFSATGWFYANIVSIIILIVLMLMALLDKVSLDSEPL